MNVVEYGFKRVVEELQREQGNTNLIKEELKSQNAYNVASAAILASIDEQMKIQTGIISEMRDCLKALCGNGAVIQAETHRIVNGLKNGKYEV